MADSNIRVFRCTSQNPKAPFMNALITIDGVEYEAGLWLVTDRETEEPRRDKNGKRWYSGEVKRKDDQQSAPPQDNSEDIPF